MISMMMIDNDNNNKLAQLRRHSGYISQKYTLEKHTLDFWIFVSTRPWPAFGRQGLEGSSGGYTSHGTGTLLMPRLAPAALGSVKL